MKLFELAIDSNSSGQKIFSTEEGIRNFWTWFGESKIIDSAGKPLVVYHGTTNDFSSFSSDYHGKSGVKDNQGGYYFAGKADTANFFAGNGGKNSGGNIQPVYLKMNNPLVVRLRWWQDDSPRARQQLIAKARGGNHDGVVIHNIFDRNARYPYEQYFADKDTIYIVFKSEQVKSAIGNKGGFDPTYPNITESSDPNALPDTLIKRIIRDACRHVVAPKPGQVKSPLENNVFFNHVPRLYFNKTDRTRTWTFEYDAKSLASSLSSRTGPVLANTPDGWKLNTVASLTKHIKKVITLVVYGVSRENMGLKAVGVKKPGDTKYTPIPIREFDADKYVVGTKGSFQLIFDANNSRTWNIDIARMNLESQLAPIAKTLGFKLGEANWKNISDEKLDKFDWAWSRQVATPDTVLVLRQPGVYRLDENAKLATKIDFQKLYSGSDEATKASISKALTDKLEKNQKGNIIAANSRSAALKALLKEADPILKEYNKTAVVKVSYSIQKIELNNCTYSRYSDSIVFRFKKATK